MYLESKQLFLERESDPEMRRMYRDMLSECVIQGIEFCLDCGAERAYLTVDKERELLCC